MNTERTRSIEAFLERLKRLWKADPTMRLGQMAYNVAVRKNQRLVEREGAGALLREISDDDLLRCIGASRGSVRTDGDLDALAARQAGPRGGDPGWIAIDDAIESLRSSWLRRSEKSLAQLIAEAMEHDRDRHRFYGIDDEELLARIAALA